MGIRKVLVTGAGGLMGGYVIDKLLGHYDLYGIDILPDKKGLPHIQDTILNYEAVRRACEGCRLCACSWRCDAHGWSQMSSATTRPSALARGVFNEIVVYVFWRRCSAL